MSRWRLIVGMISGSLMLLSSAAHGVLGWKAMKAALEQAKAPDELIQALGMGWRFGGAAMFAFGCIVVASFSRRRAVIAVPPMPAIVIGATYVVFGAWALAASHFDPFFFIFVVPGVLLLLASLPTRQA